VVDVGCGKGDFLSGLRELPSTRKYALDLNEPAIEHCRTLGFHSFCGTIESALRAGFLTSARFDVVTSFHCLEHVENPVTFVRSLLDLVAPGGRVFVSTPYSPMSFEDHWFDILNHPPHHMTRWNLSAYRKLATLLGVDLRWFSPRSPSLRRALGTFRLLRYGPHTPVNKGRLTWDLIRNGPEFLQQVRNQQRRAARNGGIAADLILVELTPRH
jgi:SAM-dependent methyltransferase